MITENKFYRTVTRPEGVYRYNKEKNEYTLWIRDEETQMIEEVKKISEYKFRKAIREEREEWKSSTEDF